MLHTLLLAALGTAFLFLMTTLGAGTVLFFAREGGARTQRAMLGFAAGVMTAASVWSLILPALEQLAAAGRVQSVATVGGGIALGSAFLLALDVFCERRGEVQENVLLLAAITLHNIPEGMAVGLAFALAADGEGLAGAAALALGIGVQNFPEGAAVALPLRQAGKRRGEAFLAGVLSGAVEPLFGVAAALAAVRVRPLMPWLLSFAAGAMLCVTAEELGDLVDSLPYDNVGCCWDVEHASICHQDQRKALQYLGKRLKATHISDYNSIKNDHILPFSGLSDWTEITDALRLAQYDGDFTYETHNFTAKMPDEVIMSGLKHSIDIGNLLIDMIQGGHQA